MRIARAVSAYDQPDPTIDRIVESSGLDVLQLDYRWPPTHLLEQKQDWGTFAPGFLKQLRTLYKSLFLDPNLRLITNAGGGDTLGCIEAICQFLCEQNDSELPITAIRGDNILSQLEELLAAGIELEELSTRQRIQDITQPLLAAHIEIGAGPLATAFDEGSRLVVAGCYDTTSPSIAAAVSSFRWPWTNLDALANVAVASQLPCSTFDVEDNGKVTIQRPHDELSLYLTTQNAIATHADVGYRTADIKLCQLESGAVQLEDVIGQTVNDRWRLRLTYVAGYRAEAIFDCGPESSNSKTEQEIGALQELLNTGAPQHREVTFERLKRETEGTLLRICCRSQQPDPCEQFVRQITNHSVRPHTFAINLTGTRPRVERLVDPKLFEVPREAIPISVDTRPAKEWI